MSNIEQALKSEDVYMFDINQPFVTQEQKFKYWEESKDEIKRLKSALTELEKCEPVGEVSVDYQGFTAYRKIKDLPEGYHKVYATPQQREWVGLSNADIREAANAMSRYTTGYDFARAIEVKLKQLNTKG